MEEGAADFQLVWAAIDHNQVSAADVARYAFDGVHVLYVGEPGLMRTQWLQAARDRPMLIVTDMPQGLDVGSALNFVPVQDRLRFEASLRAVDRTGLKVSSRLLALAQRVVNAP